MHAARFQATARAHRHEAASGRQGAFAGGDGDLDVELDTDKQKKRMAVDHNRVRDRRCCTHQSSQHIALVHAMDGTT